MRLILAFGLALTAATASLAAPQDRVRTLLEAISYNWRDDASVYQDPFSDARLASLYSSAFATAFRAAWDRGGPDSDGIFETDFFINADTGCPFENLKVDQNRNGAGVMSVTARFNAFGCERGEGDRLSISHLVFKIVDENGRDVIDDIVRIDEGGKETSIRTVMDSYGR